MLSLENEQTYAIPSVFFVLDIIFEFFFTVIWSRRI